MDDNNDGKEWEEIEKRLSGDDMHISGEIPQSTLIVAGALWTVLFGLMVWLLMISVNHQGDLRSIATQQLHNSQEFRRIDANLGRLEEHNRDQDRRIGTLEGRR